MKKTRMRGQRGTPSQQTGIALLGALVVVAIVAVSAGLLLEQQAVLSESLQTERDRAQGRWLLRGGLDWARQTLQKDAKHNSVTRLDGLWAQPVVGLRIDLPQRGQYALFSGHIQDEQGKFNVNDLVAPPSPHALTPSQHTAHAQLQQLLTTLGLPTSLIPVMEQRLRHAQTQPIFWRSILDLVSEYRLSQDQQQRLSDHLTLLPAGTALNINTASAAVLSATIHGLDLAHAQALIQTRNRGQWFRSTGDLINRINIRFNHTSRPLEIGSRWFMVQGQVTLEHAARHMQVLLYRPDDKVPVIRWIKE